MNVLRDSLLAVGATTYCVQSGACQQAAQATGNSFGNITSGVFGFLGNMFAALNRPVVMNHGADCDGTRGIGDNGGPPLDDDPNIGPPDSLDPTSALLATLAATATIGEGNANDRWYFDRHFEGTGIDSNVVRDQLRNELGNLLRQGHLKEPGSQYVGTIQINGRTVEFRARHVPGRGVNVGTTFPRDR